MTESVRTKRVAEAIRVHLGNTLARRISDPRLAGVVITAVSVTDDLGIAFVRVRHLDGTSTPAVLKALHKASGRLRGGLGPAIGLKRVPELRFSHDDGPDKVARVEELLAEIAAEPKSRE